jgi:glycosyltransferase involved in cell wall biosynthesis
MRIAIYYPWICLKGGVERTIVETVKNSKHDYTIFTNHFDKRNTFSEFKKFKVVVLNNIPARSGVVSNILATTAIIFQKIELSGFDLFLVHSEGLADLITFRNNSVPTVFFCYTPLRPIFDENHMRYVTQKNNRVTISLFHIFSASFKLIDRYLWSKFKNVIFISKESLSRAKRGGLIKNHTKTTILHPGVNWEGIKPSMKFDNYFLLPGRVTWSKNIELAINAFILFRNMEGKNLNFELIVAGGVNKKNLGYLKKLRLMVKKDKYVKFVINPSETTLKRLYSNCYATLSTAMHEDWGLTPIEGNAYGKAAMCVKSGGYMESQINSKTGYLVKNQPKDLANAMSKLANDLKLTQRLGKYSRFESKKYSWNKFRLDLNELLKLD